MSTDFIVTDHGSIIILTPESDEAKSWTDDYIAKDAQRFGTGIVVEQNYMAPILDGIINDGFTIDINSPRFH